MSDATGTRVRERISVRRRRRVRKEGPNALDLERWRTGTSRRLRRVTLGLAALVLLVIALYLIFRRPG